MKRKVNTTQIIASFCSQIGIWASKGEMTAPDMQHTEPHIRYTRYRHIQECFEWLTIYCIMRIAYIPFFLAHHVVASCVIYCRECYLPTVNLFHYCKVLCSKTIYRCDLKNSLRKRIFYPILFLQRIFYRKKKFS